MSNQRLWRLPLLLCLHFNHKKEKKKKCIDFHKNPWQPRLSSYIVMQYTKWDKLGLADVSSIL